MTTAVAYQHHVSHRPPLKETFVMKIKAFMQAMKDARRRRMSVASLQTLDSRALADIGMSRSEITSVVYNGAGDRRRSYESN